MFLLSTYRDSRVVPEKPVKPDIDLMLHYRREMYDDRGRPVASPKLPGISGCLVWAVMPERRLGSGVWVPASLGVAAVDSAYYHSKYIRAKKLNILEGIFAKSDPVAAQEIGVAIRGQ